ncbi:TrmB family transcriptional regulator [archaeon]|jgi:sugar-specific transcriptional regulator TrmB|nr:TrmB family transcriptional regulator [archaeon]MBT3451048.1 TrmB family transcriptional regulator [archaeon]MBT6869138.1 TrmB family transcriptional regulator [archaeon]MBT7192785.1 TrmB family transcriptional regulator [archaeon]MBT7381325.1 TrmB family transcriptional regulator [archaeon]
MDYKKLEFLGLTKNESLVYISLLKLGTSKTGKILKDSGLNSGKIYEILESLKNKGLASESVIDNVKHFTASPPEEMVYLIKEKKEEIDKQEVVLKNLLPQLEKIRNLNLEEPRSVIYKGFKGFKTAVNEATKYLEQNPEILAMGISSSKDERISRFWRTWTLKISAHDIKIKYLFSDRGGHYEQTKKIKNCKCKVIEDITPVTVDIFGNKVVLILNYDEPIHTTLIVNEKTATSFRTFFNQLWKKGKY